MKQREKTTSTLPFTLEMYAEPLTRVELIITELPGTILVKIDTDTNPNRQGGLFSNIHIPHTVTDILKSEQGLTRKQRRQPSLQGDSKHVQVAHKRQVFSPAELSQFEIYF